MSEVERRMTPTERLYELSMAWAHRQPSPPEQSVDVTRNAKGDFQFNVTVRGHDADECVAKAIQLTETLEQRFPRGNGGPA